MALPDRKYRNKIGLSCKVSLRAYLLGEALTYPYFPLGANGASSPILLSLLCLLWLLHPNQRLFTLHWVPAPSRQVQAQRNGQKR